MNRKSLVSILLALFVIGADAAQVTHFMASSDGVSAQWSENGLISGTTSVFVWKTTDVPSFLVIMSSLQDTTTGNLTELNGVGSVSGAILKVSGHAATISIDLANAPGFTLTSSVFDASGILISQTTISTGTINISVTSNGFISMSSHGVSSFTNGNVTVKQEGDQSSVTAFASGSFLNSALPSDAVGSISIFRSNSITVTRGP
jgi:hypothetical protein